MHALIGSEFLLNHVRSFMYYADILICEYYICSYKSSMGRPNPQNKFICRNYTFWGFVTIILVISWSST